MMEHLLHKRLRIRIDEPEMAQDVFTGTVLGSIEVNGVPYTMISVEGHNTWFAVRPRYMGETIENVLAGEDVIVNIGRPKDINFGVPTPGSEIPADGLHFFAIGSISLLEE